MIWVYSYGINDTYLWNSLTRFIKGDSPIHTWNGEKTDKENISKTVKTYIEAFGSDPLNYPNLMVATVTVKSFTNLDSEEPYGIKVVTENG